MGRGRQALLVGGALGALAAGGVLAACSPAPADDLRLHKETLRNLDAAPPVARPLDAGPPRMSPPTNLPPKR